MAATLKARPPALILGHRIRVIAMRMQPPHPRAAAIATRTGVIAARATASPPRTPVIGLRRAALTRSGIRPKQRDIAHSRRGVWRMARHAVVMEALSNRVLKKYKRITPSELAGYAPHHLQPPDAENRTSGGVGALTGEIPSGRPNRMHGWLSPPVAEVVRLPHHSTSYSPVRSQITGPATSFHCSWNCL
jgi:hypothetical protein